MSDTAAGPLTANLMRRLRDPDAVGMSRDFVRSVLSDAQRMVNGRDKLILETATVTINPHQLFYKISDIVPSAMRIEFVRVNMQDLKRTSVRELMHTDLKWMRAVGPAFKLYALPGRELFVIWPGRSVSATVDIIYTKLTNELTGDDIESEIPIDGMLDASDLAEIILLTKKRDYALLKPLLERFNGRQANEQK